MKWSRLAIGIVAVISVITLHVGRWNNAPLHTDLTVIRGDGQGFYAWLPAVFIYHDLNFSYYEDTTQHIEGYFSPRFLNNHNGKTILKTPCGEAMMVAPFFLANLAIRSITGKSSTGYEASYQRVLGWAALFYFLAGLWCMVYMLKRLGIDDVWRAMVIIVTALGTNLWYYAIYHPSMTHVYSFFLVAFACVLWIRWSDNRNRSSMLLLGIVLGLIYLVRPVNLMVVMAFPLFVNSTRKWWAGLPETFLLINRNLGQLAIGVVMFVGVVGIQLVLNYMQCGDAFAWAYKNEGFDFLHPRLGSVWWNFNKGLFIYTPLVLVALAGLACKPGFRSLWWISYFVLVSYVTSSWWNWNYGSGFGMRPFVDFYALLLLPLAFW
ncbi:MAG: hypothetical protein JNM00_09000, partial [Flavobacteriales bacterium]|nr:hypothetical protein [Flavobacteriales bacterium]